MPQNYVPLFIFIAVVGVLIPITLLAAKLIRPDNPSRAKLMPYECGKDPVGSARERFSVKFYLIAMLFILFLPITDYKTVRMKLCVLCALVLVLTASVTRTHVPDPIVASLVR